jgi:hypothetical protein
MYPPPQGFHFNLNALSGILGSVSIACWVVVFSPQIVENFRRGSAEGLSVIFIFSWLVGDVFNILGAVLQGVLPTMIILALYYTFADALLLGQVFYYEGLTLKDKVKQDSPQQSENQPTETSTLLQGASASNGNDQTQATTSSDLDLERQTTFGSFRERLLSVDATHLSKAMPLLPERKADEEEPEPVRNQSAARSVAYNLIIVLLVTAAGIFGWWLGGGSSSDSDSEPEKGEGGLEFSFLGQVFGYICALLYLFSRVPQLLLNYHRKSTEGISMLFFIFACIGNLTYALSIFSHEPRCKKPTHCKAGEAASLYGTYIAVNASWILGSIGSLLLDLGVFVQYFMYQVGEDESDSGDDFETEDAQQATVVSRGSHGRRPVIAYEGEN